MCLTIPMRVEEVTGLVARCSAKGVERTASLAFMMDDLPSPGEYVLINLGLAVRRIPADEAEETWKLYDQLLAGEEITL
ncbi:MAG: HypC/HybG/HupF family hydrogenase formation chaperone [Magnetospirillum sp. WYHS-4]